MAGACIYTLDPDEGGGVPAKMLEMAGFLQQCGHKPHLLYNGTSDLTSNRCDALCYLLSARPRWKTYQHLESLVLPYYPLPPWLVYLMPLLMALPLVIQSQIHVAVAGSNHCGLTPALLRKRFIAWVGTLYEEELRGKASVGDVWARRVLHGASRHLLAWEERFVFERASLILTNGAHTAHNIRSRFPWVAERVRVVLYPLDTAAVHPDPAVRFQQPHPYIIFTGRINDPRKNLAMLFRAFAKIRAQHPRLMLRLTGDLPSPVILRSAIEAGVADAVEFLGRQSREALIRLYQGAELFVLPSTQEGLGISMLEALACGLPVVSTRCGGPESVVIDGETGLLVDNNNADALAAGVLQLLANPAELEAKRARCAEFAQDTYSKAAIERKLLDAFQVVYPEYF